MQLTPVIVAVGAWLAGGFTGVAVTVGDEWPRPMVMRGRKRKGVRYFGPYGHAYAIRETLDDFWKFES